MVDYAEMVKAVFQRYKGSRLTDVPRLAVLPVVSGIVESEGAALVSDISLLLAEYVEESNVTDTSISLISIMQESGDLYEIKMASLGDSMRKFLDNYDETRFRGNGNICGMVPLKPSSRVLYLKEDRLKEWVKRRSQREQITVVYFKRPQLI